jgi:two-component system chemotaxis response regulator CheB
VLVVDDSAVIRGLMRRMLEEDPAVAVVDSASNGELAVKGLARQAIDVVVLDIEMPVMDGLTAIPKLLEVDPEVRIIMASTLTLRNAEVSLKALAAGASDYVAKPTSTQEIAGAAAFKRELVEKVKCLGAMRRGRRPPGKAVPAAKPAPGREERPAIALRTPSLLKPHVIAIGSSTGGPQALFTLLKGVKSEIKLPIVITQHMPATFTTILAEHIQRESGWPCAEAKDGEALAPGRIFLAPGNYHMVVERAGVQQVLRLNQDPPENFCRPAVDPMLRSVAKVFGGRTLAVILTGMGADGLEGGKAVVEAGGAVVAQDEKTSVVWGMPGAVATAGICSAVLPIGEIAPYIAKIAGA